MADTLKDLMTDECPPYGTCDWGCCNEEAVRWRWEDGLEVHLPVCIEHSAETELRALRESHDALEAAAKVAKQALIEDTDHTGALDSLDAALAKAEALQ